MPGVVLSGYVRLHKWLHTYGVRSPDPALSATGTVSSRSKNDRMLSASASSSGELDLGSHIGGSGGPVPVSSPG